MIIRYDYLTSLWIVLESSQKNPLKKSAFPRKPVLLIICSSRHKIIKLGSLHMPPCTFGALVTSETRRTYTITTGITYPPGPIVRQLFTTIHTWDKHNLYTF
jgi:hypothetical protein